MREFPLIVKRKKLFRCHRPKCQPLDMGKFFSANPTCPQCGLSPADPKFGDKIQRLVMVHFDPPTEFPGRGEQVRACEPSKGIQCEGGTIPNPWHAGTGSITAVTCPICRKMPIFRYAVELAENEDESNSLAGAFARLQAASKG